MEIAKTVEDLRVMGFSRDQVARCINVDRYRLHRICKGEGSLTPEEEAKLIRVYHLLKEAAV